MTIGLGIDTGGTYTDSVILDMDSGRILSRAKDLTTRNDLVIGITGSIGKHRPELLKKISLVSLSSTLATNSVVEGKGCRAGLISIGRRYDGTVTADVYARWPDPTTSKVTRRSRWTRRRPRPPSRR